MWEGQTGPVLKDCICAGRTGPVQEGQDLCGKDKIYLGRTNPGMEVLDIIGKSRKCMVVLTGLFGGQGQGARREV